MAAFLDNGRKRHIICTFRYKHEGIDWRKRAQPCEQLEQLDDKLILGV